MNPSPPAATERRMAPRFQPALGTVCRVTLPDNSTVVGLVWNISETGISMLVGEPPKPGIELAAELRSEAGGSGLAVTLRVMHVKPIETGDFFLGAQFTRPLRPDEMLPFLAARLFEKPNTRSAESARPS